PFRMTKTKARHPIKLNTFFKYTSVGLNPKSEALNPKQFLNPNTKTSHPNATPHIGMTPSLF
ncbi:MAG: hypothetical protein Q7R34_15205, partial [Dehalococcoidia bacterium]|nr:hypothetical protein [Dehalococcoidia bacterium]